MQRQGEIKEKRKLKKKKGGEYCVKSTEFIQYLHNYTFKINVKQISSISEIIQATFYREIKTQLHT